MANKLSIHTGNYSLRGFLGGRGSLSISICIYLLTCSFFILLVLPVLGRGVLIRDRVSDIEISLISKNTILIKILFRMSILWWTRTDWSNVVKISGFFEWSYLQMDFSFFPTTPVWPESLLVHCLVASRYLSV